MNFFDIINRLERIFRILTAAAIALSITEALIVLFIGIASNNISTPDPRINSIWIGILISLIVVYVAIIIVKILYNANFPSSITNELKAQRELSELKDKADRQKAISDFVVQTIERLNVTTCSLTPGDDTQMCDSGLKDGINQLIQPVIANTHFLLNTLNTEFTVGLYLASYRTLANTRDNLDKGIIILKDTLLPCENEISKELIQEEGLAGVELEIQAVIRKSLNNHKFVEETISNAITNFTIICSPMPFACEENSLLGVLFIISKYIEKTPEDLPTTLTIFNRIISNWVYRYDGCIISRLSANRGQG